MKVDLFILYEFDTEKDAFQPVGVGIAPSAEKAVENVRTARAHMGNFTPVQLRADRFYDAPFEDVVRCSLDAILNAIFTSGSARPAAPPIREKH